VSGADLQVEPGAEGITIVFGFRRGVVAIGRPVRPRHELLDQFQRHRTEPLRGNDVAGKRQARLRVPQRGAASEVSRALRVRQDDDFGGIATPVAVCLVIAEAEDPILQDWSADAAAELVLLQRGLRGGRTGEEIARLKLVVPIELPGRTVQLVGASLRDHVHDRAGVAAEFGAVRMRLDLEFLNGVRRRAHHETRIERVVVAGAVEEKVVRLVPHAIDVEAGGDSAKSSRRGVSGRATQSRRGRDDTRYNESQLREVASVERELDNFLMVDRDPERRVRGFDERRLGNDYQLFREPADGQLHIRATCVADRHLHSFTNGGFESRQSRSDSVPPWLKQRDRVKAVAPRHSGTHEPCRDISGLDGRTGYRSARLVGDQTAHAAGRLRMRARDGHR
jgi:hypothetical protein